MLVLSQSYLGHPSVTQVPRYSGISGVGCRGCQSSSGPASAFSGAVLTIKKKQGWTGGLWWIYGTKKGETWGLTWELPALKNGA